VPAPQLPLARLAPHPRHILLTVRLFEEQTSAQVPACVPQPVVALHVAVQHSLLPPGVQVVALYAHEQLRQAPSPSQWRVQFAG